MSATAPTPTSPSTPTPTPSDTSAKTINPWLFVPVLYFMQFLPNGLVTSLFSAVYKSLGVENLKIAMWTGLAALPWTFKMFWGPLVDLNSTKRRWTCAMQAAITVVLLLTAGAIATPQFFVLTVIAMFLMATLSATHDIACDGLYLMSLDKQRQAAFSGVMGAASRLGRLFVDSILVVFAGYLINRGVEKQSAWMIALGIAAAMYAAGAVWNFFMLPRPAADVPAADVPPEERTRNIWRTLAIIAAGVTLYFFIAATIELIGFGIFRNLHGNTFDAAMAMTDAEARKAALAGLPKPRVPANWHMTAEALRTQTTILVACLVLLPICALIIRKLVRNTTMGEAFVSYARQRGFGAILSFIVFYRFGEAMIFAMAALFILDSREAGGMGMTLGQLGLVKGLGQPLGLMFGGLLGGWWISKVGLRKAFWPLVVCMHTPNLLYVWTAYALPDPIWLYPVVFIEAFGYGVGFAGYFVFLMQVAQRGRFVTSHYAIGTGLGALFITFATIAAGIVQSVFGYTGVFIAACLMTIPGTLVLLFIPLDNEQSKELAAKAAGGH